VGTMRFALAPRLRRRYPKGRATSERPMDDRDLYSGFVRLHVLHHGARGPIFGLGVMEQLAQRGYRLSAGTLYPILHGLAAKGYLRVTEHREGRHARKMYRTTPEGRRALADAKARLKDLFGEFFRQP